MHGLRFVYYSVEEACATVTGGSLDFLGPDMQEELASITFDHIGIISMEQEAVEANAEGIARFTVELYAEEMSFDVYNSD